MLTKDKIGWCNSWEIMDRNVHPSHETAVLELQDVKEAVKELMKDIKDLFKVYYKLECEDGECVRLTYGDFEYCSLHDWISDIQLEVENKVKKHFKAVLEEENK